MMGGFVWQVLKGELRLVGGQCFGRALFSGLVGWMPGLWLYVQVLFCDLRCLGACLWFSDPPSKMQLCLLPLCSFSFSVGFSQSSRQAFPAFFLPKPSGMAAGQALKDMLQSLYLFSGYSPKAWETYSLS